MSQVNKPSSFQTTAQKLVALAFAVCINVLLLWAVGALFSIDLSVSSGRVI